MTVGNLALLVKMLHKVFAPSINVQVMCLHLMSRMLQPILIHMIVEYMQSHMLSYGFDPVVCKWNVQRIFSIAKTRFPQLGQRMIHFATHVRKSAASANVG